MTAARRAAGALLIVVPLVFMAGFTGLQLTFDYPGILRQPPGEVLARFAAAGWDLHVYWYAMMAAALALIPAAVAVGLALWKRNSLLTSLSIATGVLAGLVQALGLIRWVMLTPVLAANYIAPGASEADQAIAAAIFEATNAYLGVAVGEHLGYFFTGAWTLLVSTLIFQRQRILAVSGATLSLGVITGMAEPFGVALAANINAIAFSLWAIWALALGVTMLRRPREEPSATLQPA